MKFDYNPETKTVIIDGKGTKTFTTNDIGIEMTESFVNSKKDIKLEIQNLYIVGNKIKGFRRRIKETISAIKYIWLK
jgi:hypothetical protein